MERIYVLAPNWRQATFWLHEFGTRILDPRVIVMPVDRGLRRPFTDSIPPACMGCRWRDGDEFLIVGDPERIDWRSVALIANHLRVPDDELYREWEANHA